MTKHHFFLNWENEIERTRSAKEHEYNLHLTDAAGKGRKNASYSIKRGKTRQKGVA